ncbi:MAG: hypothetical protein KGI88_08235 [Betaproteobacteria bacterium]|nr:hypothetical protein [Betaproteobacteria bacterium]
MTIYQVHNLYTKPDYFVSDAATLALCNKSLYKNSCVIGTLADAEAKLASNVANVLQQEANRFQIHYVVLDNNNYEKWDTTDISNTPENGIYKVFNTLTGVYNEYSTKTEAIAADQKIKQDYLASLFMDSVKVIPEMIAIPKQPKSTGTQTL